MEFYLESSAIKTSLVKASKKLYNTANALFHR